MKVTGESRFISVKTGQKNGKDWYAIKFQDEDADEYFTAFVDKSLYTELQGVPKKTGVFLTLNITPGQKFFSVDSIEVLD